MFVERHACATPGTLSVSYLETNFVGGYLRRGAALFCIAMELAELFVFLLVVSAGKSLEIDLSSSETFTWRASLSNGSKSTSTTATLIYLNEIFLKGITVPGTVPGSIYSDLDKANYFTGGPLLYRFNDLDYRWVSYLDWDYSLTFDGISTFC